MAFRVGSVKNDNFKKVFSLCERVICILTVVFCTIVSIMLLIHFNGDISFVVLAYVCIVFDVTALLKMFVIPFRIVIGNNRIKVFDFPLLATNKFYKKKRSLILWNSVIDVDEIEKIELIKLSKEEQKQYVGYKHLFNKYLKFTLKYGSSKYVYVGCYSNCQIKKIIKAVTIQ